MTVPTYIPSQECTLPDLLALCPFEGSTNPHYYQAANESAAWVDSYDAFTGRKREHFRMSCFELLAANAYPYANHDKLRMCCDLINLLSVVDEVCDDQTGEEAYRLSKSYLSALNGGPCDGTLISRIAKDFRNRLENHVSPTSRVMRRYLQESANTVNAIAEETDLRERSQKLDTSEFVEFRRRNSAILVCLPFIEVALGIELPDEVFDDHNFQKMYNAAADIISWTNDICSYCREASKGIAEINIITVLMRNEKLSLQEAMDHAGLLFKTQIDYFLQGKASIRSFGSDTDLKVKAYVMGLEQWIVGSTNWCFDAGRFFGLNNEDVKKTRVVNFQQIMCPEVMSY